MNKLIKDIILFLSVGALLAILLAASSGEMDFTVLIVLTFLFGGVPFGWRWASHIITAVSFMGIVIKFMIALFLGFIAAPVEIIKDIIVVVKEKRNPPTTGSGRE